MTNVVHCKKEPYDVYIGRHSVNPMHYGNPWSHKPKAKAIIVSTKAEAINNFRDWIMGTKFKEIEPDRRQWILNNLQYLKDKILGCWCKPGKCHGDIYVILLKYWSI